MPEAAAEFRYDATNTRRGLPLCVLFTALGAYVLTQSSDPVGLLVGAVFIGVGALGTHDYAKRWRDQSVVLRIGPEGIIDKRLGRNLLRWEQIIAIEERETWSRNPTPYLDLHLDKSARVDAGAMALFWRLSGARGFVISTEGLEGTFHSIFRAAKHFADQRSIPFYTHT